ncbi:ankyrin repeat domain-containing protein [Massilia agilis]|uniref:Ankyrin repeat domain-containing protein n=1 Tax=Massilia agilis TaxID=1811226 RepID=A0ABT2D8N1_9BURK|nr:ankyrin repeat domain-containing protein [Massilia agilis]MCS0807672.1 ankyrin repeat domain-containing protein [Massilia agilis]
MTTPRRAIFRSFLFSVCMLVGAAQAATSAQVAEFFRAVQTDDARTVKSMLAGGFDANSLNPVGGEPALVLAAREGAMQVLDTLLAHPGTRIDTPAVNGNTALMMAAFKHNMPAVQALLAKGAAVNRDGWTPLHYAAAGGDNEIARLLLKHGAKIDALSPRASGAYTPLMMAAREGHDSTALLLIDSGANPGLTNSEGLTPAQLAERAGKSQVAAAIAARAARH